MPEPAPVHRILGRLKGGQLLFLKTLFQVCAHLTQLIGCLDGLACSAVSILSVVSILDRARLTEGYLVAALVDRIAVAVNNYEVAVLER